MQKLNKSHPGTYMHICMHQKATSERDDDKEINVAIVKNAQDNKPENTICKNEDNKCIYNSGK
jgi:hypothetical protein